jgi:hypothetical protein
MNLREKNEQIQNINIYKCFENFVNDNRTFFLDLMKEQMIQGKTGSDSDPYIGTYRNINYAKEKQIMNPKASGRVDLYYTGSFYDAEYFNVKSTNSNVEIEFYSSDEKADMLTSKYGSIIWKFNSETLLKSKSLILKNFKHYIL